MLHSFTPFTLCPCASHAPTPPPAPPSLHPHIAGVSWRVKVQAPAAAQAAADAAAAKGNGWLKAGTGGAALLPKSACMQVGCWGWAVGWCGNGRMNGFLKGSAGIV